VFANFEAKAEKRAKGMQQCAIPIRAWGFFCRKFSKNISIKT